MSSQQAYRFEIYCTFGHEIAGHCVNIYDTGLEKEILYMHARRNQRFKYDPSCVRIQSQWTRINEELFRKDCPESREYMTIIQYKYEFFIFGGRDADADVVHDNLWVFSPETELYKPIKTENSTIARWKHSSVVLGNRMVVFGGIFQAKRTNQLSLYDFEENEWSEHCVPEQNVGPTPRCDQVCISDHKYMILFGGMSDFGKENDLWRWSVKKKWEKLEAKGDGPKPRNGHAGCVWQKCLYIFGGEVWDERKTPCKVSDLWQLDLSTHTWKEYKFWGKVTPRMYSCLFEFQGLLHLLGGLTGSTNDLVVDNFMEIHLEGIEASARTVYVDLEAPVVNTTVIEIDDVPSSSVIEIDVKTEPDAKRIKKETPSINNPIFITIDD